MVNTAPLQYLVFRNFTGDYLPQILDEVYMKKIYFPFVNGKRDLIVADFGANQGVTSYYFSKYAKHIYAVEPSQIHLEVLKHMIELNRLQEKITVCNYAISNENGKTRFYHSPNPTAFSLTNFMPPEATDFEEVETITIKEFFKRNTIEHLDILKLDIEGAEGKLISSPEFEEVCPKINAILGEWHDWAGISKDLFSNRLRDLGYTFSWRNDTQAACFEAVRI